jgi:hypothetical protein
MNIRQHSNGQRRCNSPRGPTWPMAKLPGVQLTQPTGKQRTFADVGALAKWSVANALGDGKQIN